MNRLLFLSALAFLIGSQVKGQVVINEVSASNMATVQDNFGEYEDWVELYNAGAAQVDLNGWYLSDKQGNPLKWQFPGSAIIPAGGYFMVWCSALDQLGPGGAHPNFKLKQSTDEWVVLSDASGNLVDDFELLDNTQLGHSWGRTTNGAATWSLFTTPTPNGANAGSVPNYVPTPQMAPAAGFYNAAQSVTLSCADPNATIYYTLNGDEPSAASTQYTGPINVAQTTVIRAIAINGASGAPNSFFETNTYFINDNHTIAVLSICGDQVDDLLNGTQQTPTGHMEYFGEDQLLRDEGQGEYNKHGNDSWAYDQRGFDFIMRDQHGYNDAMHYPMFRTKNRDEFQRLIIKAAANDNYPFEDGAHIRDAYIAALSHEAELKVDERTYEPCIVYLNGQYWGVYEYREKYDDKDFTRHYYQQDEFNLQFLKTWGGTWAEYGGVQAENDWDALVQYIMNNNMGTPANFAYVDSLYNWESLLDYVILNGYVVAADWLNWNTAWWRGMDPNGQKKRWRYTLWDMDATFGHYINYTGVPNTGPSADPCDPEILGDPGGQGHIPILNKLISENQDVRDYYVNRYIDLSNTVFQCDHMHSFLDSLIALIDPEMQRHCTRWNGVYTDWQANVQDLKDFIDDRCAEVTTGLTSCYQLTGPHEVTFDVFPPNSGEIKINSVFPSNYPHVGNYYGNITTDLEARAAAGWAFGYWTIDNDTILPSLTDSIVYLTIDTTDLIIAHFIPPITHDVVLDVEPDGAADILFMNQVYTTFPQLVSVPEGVAIQAQVLPKPYFDWLNWETENAPILAPYSGLDEQIELSFFTTDTVIAHLEAQPHAYYVPNSFSPNGDGYNDEWIPLGSAVDVDDFSLQVFDRWGEVVFQSTDWTTGWDGSYNGSTVPIGVYAYRIAYRNGITKEKFEVIGHVTAVK